MTPLMILLAMAGWIALNIGISQASRRGLGKGASEYFLAGRRLGGFVSGMNYAATTYSAFMLVGLVGLTYSRGIGALGFEMTYFLFTVLFLVAFAPRFWLVGRRHGLVTPSELLAHRYQNRGVGAAAAVVSFVMLIPYASVQLIGVGDLVTVLTGGRVPYMAGVLFMAVLAGTVALWAGMRSVAWTNAVKAVVMIGTSLFAFIFLCYAFFGSPGAYFASVPRENPQLLRLTWNPSMFIGLSLPWAFFALTNPQVSQRLFVPSSPVALRRMIVYFSVFGFLYTVLSVLFGLQAAHIVPGLKIPDRAMPELLARVPPGLALVVFIGIFAAASSVLSGIALTLGSMFSRDVVRAARPGLSESAQTWAGRAAVVVLLLACVAFARLRPSLISILSSAASGGLLVMVPAILAVFFWPRATAAGALVSMIVGGAVTVALYVLQLSAAKYTLLGTWPPVWGLGVTVVLFVAVSLLTRAPEGAGEYIAQVESDLEQGGFRRPRPARRG